MHLWALRRMSATSDDAVRMCPSELSLIDTIFLRAGMLPAAACLTAETKAEAERRELCGALYRRADRPCATNFRWPKSGSTSAQC